MKNILPIQLIARLAAILLMAGWCVTAVAETTNVVIVPKSSFADDPGRGKDPFFPDSTRRMQVVAQKATPGAPVRQNIAPDAIFLKGISGSKLQPLALINNATLGAGEASDIRVGLQLVKIQCKAVRERSALVEIVSTGEIRELKLRDGF
jgi:hypothetical protein